MLRLKCQAMNYAWGRKAEESEVAQLQKAAGEPVDGSKPYAELWMGTHPSGPSTLASNGLNLKDWIQQHTDALGSKVMAKFGADLPFLFKVLSVNTALSIQSHPDKKLAERLHAQNPQAYKDDNHKPEMALAITDFEALCGFVGQRELAEALQSTPELRACVGEDNATAVYLSSSEQQGCKAALKAAFTALMTCPDDTVAEAVGRLSARLMLEASGRQLSPKEQLIIRLNEQYPQDVGVLSAYFLNYVTLKQGQAIYLPANEPHAYLSGELVECMATSDNVIRAGLTPKMRDTEVLCESLTYEQGLPPVLNGDQVDKHTLCYRPPFEEFEIQRIAMGAEDCAQLPAAATPRLLLVQAGGGQAEAAAAAQGAVANDSLQASTSLARGDVFFVPAGTAFTLRTQAQPLAIWGASCNQSFLN